MTKKGSRGTGTLIRALRKELGWSKAELARHASCSERTIANLEEKAWVSDRTLMAVTDALNRAVKEKRNAGQLELPFAELMAGDLFEYKETIERGRARGAPTIPDERRKMLKAVLTVRAAKKVS
jgi:transcriptional regulator with XRE-family HTH domain